MFRAAAVPVLAILSCWAWATAESPQQAPKSDPQPKSATKGQEASLTGCIDEQQGQWVLVNDQTMAVIANLAADGFPEEAFAKHVGHKVTVRGTRSSGGTRPMFKVRSVETISESCSTR